MPQFLGFVPVGNTLVGDLVTLASTGVPTNADSAPTCRTYGPSGNVGAAGNVTATALDQANVTGLYSFSIVCSTGNGFAQNTLYTVIIQYAISGQQRSDQFTFCVI